jgi:hypothetical protein
MGYNDCERKGKPDAVPVWNGIATTFFDDYRQFADIGKFVDQLAASHPNLVTIQNIGKTWENRPLRVMEITLGGNNHGKPIVYLQAGIHAREWIATSTGLFLAWSLVSAADAEAGNGRVTEMLKQFTFAISSPANPDGYVYTWEVNRFWRKTRSNREHCATAADGVAGVDPNRNWGYARGVTVSKPGAETQSQVADACTDMYEGPYAFSEPETMAVAAYLSGIQNSSFARKTIGPAGVPVAGPGYVTTFIDYHSFAMMLLPPWGYSAAWPTGPDGTYMKGLCDAMVATIKRTSSNVFQAGPAGLPADPGTAPDWAYGVLGVRATMTVELETDFLSGSFCIPKHYIRSVGAEQFQALLTMVDFLKASGGEPSKQFGIFAGSPPPPTSLWLQQDILLGHGMHISKVGVLAFGVLLISTAMLTVNRWRKTCSVPSTERDDDDGIELAEE